MVSPEMNPTICSVFEAEIVLLFHATTFRRGFQVTVHVGNVRQTAVVEKIHAKVRGHPAMPPFSQGTVRILLRPERREACPQTQRPPSKSTKPHSGWVDACSTLEGGGPRLVETRGMVQGQ